MTDGIMVKNLSSATSLTNTASILALTNANNNTVNLIGKQNFIQTLISSTAGNGLSKDNSGLFVGNVGNLANLATTDKTSIVDAINENTNRINQPITSLATSGTIALEDNSINTIAPTGTVTFTLPSVTDLTVLHQILVQIYLGSTQTINVSTTNYFNNITPSFATTGIYDLFYEFDNLANKWICGLIYKGAI